MVGFHAIDEQHFGTLGLPVLQGRNFTPADTKGAPLVGIVSESFGRMMSNGASPIGQRVTPPNRPALRVVGVVPDIITSVTVAEPLVLYMPLAQHPIDGSAIDFTVRARGDVDAARREVVAAIRSIDAGIAPPTVLTIDERLMRQLGAQRFGAFVLGALAMIAVLLTVLGTYVLAESMAVLRTREMGIRAALGATGRQLSAIVLFDTARLVGLGIVIGLGLAWLGAGTIRALLFRVQPMDPVTLVPVSLMILVLAVVVTLRPALRVARVDLAAVLKQE